MPEKISETVAEERERSFLLDSSVQRNPFMLRLYSAMDIEQYYLAIEEDREVRIRQAVAVGRFETIGIVKQECAIKEIKKETGKPIFRVERSRQIDSDTYNALKWTASARGVYKRRFFIPIPDSTLLAEVDVYKRALEGFYKIEVEFPDWDAYHSFDPPKWFAREVTGEQWQMNKYLVGKSFADIKSFL